MSREAEGFELEVTQPGGSSQIHRIGSRPVYFGRSDSNDIVLPDTTVSSRHVAIWSSGSDVWLEDLRSRNGTFINDRRVRRVTRLELRDEVRLGLHTLLRIHQIPQGTSQTGPVLVEDMTTNVRVPLDGRLTLGKGDSAQIVVPSSEEAVLVRHFNGEVWLGMGDEMQELSFDEPFMVGDRSFCLRRASGTGGSTHDAAAQDSPYRLKVTLTGLAGPEATLVDVVSGNRHTITGETRATLLYVLAKRVEEDRTEQLPRHLQGWCDDHTATIAVWGKMAVLNPQNSLNTLVGRIRRELKKSGFDPWFMEKRRGHVRIRVQSVEIE